MTLILGAQPHQRFEDFGVGKRLSGQPPEIVDCDRPLLPLPKSPRIAERIAHGSTLRNWARARHKPEMSEISYRPKLKGERFSQHSVPVEILKDFAAFEEMLIEVARREYLTANPSRQRTPRGFAKGLELRLTGIEEGSAVLNLVLAGLLSAQFLEAPYFEQAYNKILESIASIDSGTQPRLAPEQLRYFDRFGRSLQEGESIEFSGQGASPISLTPQIRQRLLEASQAEEWTEEKTLKGRISTCNKADKTFELELSNGTRIQGPLDQQHRQPIMDAFNHYEEGHKIAIKGVVRRDRSGRDKALESVEHLNPVDPLDVELRLEELAQIKTGWLNGIGQVPASEGLKTLANAFDRFFRSDLPLPHLYPTPEGGVQAEWSTDTWDVSLEIDLKSQEAQFHALNVENGEAEVQILQLCLGIPEWDKLNHALLRIFETEHA